MRFVTSLLFAFALAAAPPRPVMFTVTKTDGSTVRGQLQTSNPKEVTIQPMLKNAPDGAAVTIPWADIKSVTGGLTRERVIRQWKKDHPADLCGDCAGSAKAACAACKGTGRDAASAKDCATCSGAQTVACNAPRCDDGKVPCPKPCLKPSDSGWFTKDDGKKWKRYASRGGSFEVSDGHMGELVEIKNGQAQPPVPCPTCNKAMTIACPKCNGTSQAACTTCIAAARQNPCPACQRGQVECKTCGGLALKPEVTGTAIPTSATEETPASQ